MTRFEITILGCGSAMPTTLHNPTSQLVNLNEKLFMIDCGEGTQLQLRRYKARLNKLHSIFISHLHGDHLFGLPGLLATLALLGRTGDLHIYAHKEVELFLNPFLKYFGNQFPYKIIVIHLDPLHHQLIFENNAIRVFSFPLKHRIPTNGFRFEEKERPRHIKREMIDFYNIPLSKINEIKMGADFETSDGKLVENEILTTPPAPPRSYAYCSDTAYYPEMVPYIKGADLLYHEATYAETEHVRAKDTFHSTARQAAEIARMANVKRLLIGHFSSRYNELDELLNEACAVFPDTELADEGMKIVL
ncbi:MAG: ribonuclease Z [Petrimonas mucosa]|jgi:ribonuclease Z|uniref:ribonuclease Z n=1 Tax=Petrimonas TaxID=307628 RepID=UPI002B25EC5E|nr:ribonuclease Z [Petrimonas sp.]